MIDKIALSDQLEERLIQFAARIIFLAGKLAKNFQGRHIANQIVRCATAAAANYAEARGAESRADFIHKMRIVQKELNESLVWLRIIVKSGLVRGDFDDRTCRGKQGTLSHSWRFCKHGKPKEERRFLRIRIRN